VQHDRVGGGGQVVLAHRRRRRVREDALAVVAQERHQPPQLLDARGAELDVLDLEQHGGDGLVRREAAHLAHQRHERAIVVDALQRHAHDVYGTDQLGTALAGDVHAPRDAAPVGAHAREPPVDADRAARASEIERHADAHPAVGAAFQRQRAGRDRHPRALRVQAQPVDEGRRQARARNEPAPLVRVGVGGAERQLEPIGAGRAHGDLGVPQPRRRRGLPGVLDGDAHGRVTPEAGRQTEVERVGAREPPAPDVSPRRADRRRASQAQRVREAQRGVAVDGERGAVGHAGHAGQTEADGVWSEDRRAPVKAGATAVARRGRAPRRPGRADQLEAAPGQQSELGGIELHGGRVGVAGSVRVGDQRAPRRARLRIAQLRARGADERERRADDDGEEACRPCQAPGHGQTRCLGHGHRSGGV
jgi:hypothetical protein